MHPLHRRRNQGGSGGCSPPIFFVKKINYHYVPARVLECSDDTAETVILEDCNNFLHNQ